MPITIREARSSKADRDWIEETYGEYLADLTADTTGVYPSLTVTGQSVSEIIQGWFHDDRCTAFLVLREQEPVAGHLGLDMLRRRVADVHGTLDVRSAPGKGTRVVARLPRYGQGVSP